MRAPRRVIGFSRGIYVGLGIALFGYVLYLLRDVLTPIFLAFTIAYILDPVVDRLERWRLPRAAGIAVVLLGFLGLTALLLLLVVPQVVSDVTAVVRGLPAKAQELMLRVEPWLTQRGVQIPHTTDEWIKKLQPHADSAASLLSPAGDALKWAFGSTLGVLGKIVAALIVPILAVYLLNDFDRIISGIRELIPMRYRDTVVGYAREIDGVLSQFMRGQVTVMAILAVLYGGAYTALGVRLAIPIGIMAGILNFIPYVGSAFALVAGLLMSVIGGGDLTQIIGVIVAYAVVQTLEGFVITPRIVGESVGLREVWVLLALFVGGEVFGFLGVLLAVPVAAVMKIFVGRAITHYKESGLFLTPAEAALVPVPPPLETPLETIEDAPPPPASEQATDLPDADGQPDADSEPSASSRPEAEASDPEREAPEPEDKES